MESDGSRNHREHNRVIERYMCSRALVELQVELGGEGWLIKRGASWTKFSESMNRSCWNSGKEQLATVEFRRDLLSENELRQQSLDFVRLFRQGVAGGNFTDITAQDWEPVKDMLASLSKSRAQQGFTPSDTALFVFSFKLPLFNRLRKEHGKDEHGLAENMWRTSVLLDKLGLYTTEIYQQSREQVIIRQ